MDTYPTPDNTPHKSRSQGNLDGVYLQNQQSDLGAFFRERGVHKRFRKILKDNLTAAINKPTIRRLARRGGVKRIKGEIYQTVQNVVKNRLAEILEIAIALAEHRRQRTLSALDVVYALKVLGNPIYGCGTIYRGDNVGSRADYMRRRRAQYAQNVRDTQQRIEREERDRRIDEQVRRLGGTVNLRRL